MDMPANAAGSSRAENKTSVFRRFSTQTVPVAERLDYWRHLFQAARIERSRFSYGQDFDSVTLSSRLVNDVTFADIQGDPVACYFGQSDSGTVLLGSVRSGAVEFTSGCTQVAHVGPQTRLVLFDCDHPISTISRHYEMTFLRLPRALVSEILIDAPCMASGALRLLPTDDWQTACSNTWDIWPSTACAWQATNAMLVARALAITLLAKQNACWRSLPQHCDDDMFIAARHQLRLHIDDSDYTGAQLASTLGCSRAHLYRLFERRGLTITGQLRELRLQLAHQRLQTRPGQAIGTIAIYCGYSDLAAFGKAFRRRFDLTPSECRAQSGTATTHEISTQN